MCRVQRVVNPATSSVALENVPEWEPWEIKKRKQAKLRSGGPLSTDDEIVTQFYFCKLLLYKNILVGVSSFP